MFSAGMSERRFVAEQISDTLFFGDLKRLKIAQQNFKRVETGNQTYYILHFGRSAEMFGFVRIDTPRRMSVHYTVADERKEKKFTSLYELKSFLVNEFVAK